MSLLIFGLSVIILVCRYLWHRGYNAGKNHERPALSDGQIKEVVKQVIVSAVQDAEDCITGDAGSRRCA